MNLFFRLFWVTLRARFLSNALSVLNQGRLKFRVWITDQDMFMHMTNSRYMSFGDLGRTDFLIRTGLSAQMRRRGWVLEIVGQTMTINRMLKFPKPFWLDTRISGWSDEYIAMSQVFDRGGRNHAGVNTLLKLRHRSGKSVPATELIALVQDVVEDHPLPAPFDAIATQHRQL